MTPLQRLIAAAEEALEFIDGYVDVIDGPDGEPMPNRAMQIVAELEAAIGRATSNSKED